MSRVVYRDGQVLSANDLCAEQAYRCGMREVHASTHHDWGIAHGLDLSISGAKLRVSRGVAVDGYGRTLVVEQEIATRLDELTHLFVTDQVVTRLVSISLVYAVEAAGENRWCEVSRLRFTAGQTPNPRHPDVAGREWPVFLGLLRYDWGNDIYREIQQGRPWIGLTGEAVRAASGVAHMLCWPDFSVGLRRQASPGFDEKLRIDPAGNLSIAAGAAIAGKVKVQPEASSPKAGVGFSKASLPPSQSFPWRLYRTTLARDASPPLNVWAIEMAPAAEKEAPGAQTAALGCGGSAAFARCLQVTAEGDVVIAGKVRIGGRMFTQVSPEASPASAAPVTTAKPAPVRLQLDNLKLETPMTTKPGVVIYRLTATNHSGSLIEIAHLQEMVTVNDQLAASPAALPAITLEPGKAIFWERSCRVESPGMLKIAVFATGTDARAGYLAASVSAQMTILRRQDGGHGD